MNKPIRKLFYISVLMFASLLVMLGYRQVVQAGDLADNPYNTRKVYAQMRIERGLILGSDRKYVFANNVEKDGLFYRFYPTQDLAPQLIGYNDDKYGQVGLEHSQNSYLTGTADEVELVNLLDTIMGKEKKGADLHLTLKGNVQCTAVRELQKTGKSGAIVVLDVKTGAVAAMASNPTYDPNRLQENWQSLITDPGSPLLNRATQGLYTPGSTFKMITTAAALESGAFKPDSEFNDTTGTYVVNGFTVHNYTSTPFGKHDLKEAFSLSINTTFAQVGNRVGQSKLIEYAQKFGLWEKPPFDLPPDEVSVSGRYVDGELAPPDAPMAPEQVASMAFGQENTLVTPLQMALVAQSIANGGRMMKPYVVDSISDYNGTVIKQASPETWRTPIQSSTAATEKDMMIKVVNEGTGRGARTDLVQIAAKTGTAEAPGQGINAWFVGFAPAGNPQYAIAVVIVDPDPNASGGISSLPARNTILSALGLSDPDSCNQP